MPDFIDAATLLHLRDGGMPLLDARSPAEFLHGHIPGALNLPVLSDEERAIVGTAHARSGPEGAVHVALELIGPQLASKLGRARSLTPRRHEVLLHCWRGGMRSRALAWLLETGGYTVHVLEGGYRAYRRHVRAAFSRPQRICILGGMTGCGKTDILQQLAARGCQVIDLEGLANHRGSAFGGVGMGEQPTNEQVENALHAQWACLDPARPVWLEDESRRVGTVTLCGEFFQRMEAAPLVLVELPLEARVDRLVRMYAETTPDGPQVQALVDAFARIRERLGSEKCARCQEAVRCGDYASAVRLSLAYYDKAYTWQLARRQRAIVHRVRLLRDDPAAAARMLAEAESSLPS